MIATKGVVPFAAAATVAVRATALTKRFGSRTVLSGVNLTAFRGECTGLTGSNGSGRSTLLGVMATLIPPTAGTVEISGRDVVRDIRDVRRRVALVGNEPPSADGLSVRQFLSWVREARRSGSNGRGPTVDETIHRAELRADAHVGALSRGGRQRLALAAALMITPEVLLLDDPLQALDESARRRFVEWIREEQQRGATIVVAVNSDADVRLLCDRVLRMEEGRLL